MKILALTKLMNDHGTKPHIKIYKNNNIIYEGKHINLTQELSNLKVNSFTVLGIGYIEIYAQ